MTINAYNQFGVYLYILGYLQYKPNPTLYARTQNYDVSAFINADINSIPGQLATPWLGDVNWGFQLQTYETVENLSLFKSALPKMDLGLVNMQIRGVCSQENFYNYSGQRFSSYVYNTGLPRQTYNSAYIPQPQIGGGDTTLFGENALINRPNILADTISFKLHGCVPTEADMITVYYESYLTTYNSPAIVVPEV